MVWSAASEGGEAGGAAGGAAVRASGWWCSREGLPGRVRWAREFRRLVAAHERELCALMEEEIGKSRWEGLTADVLPLLAACRWLERNAGRVLGGGRGKRLGCGAFWQVGERHRVVREPLGDVAVIATWNYPVQLLGIQLAQALVAGNRVVVKPSEHAPRTQARLLGLAAAALPADAGGVLGWVEATREAGRDLLAGRRLDHVVFTGSTGVGRAVAAWAAETMTPTTLELSGRDSAIVLADAETELAARAIWHGVTANAGQTCMAPRRVLVEAPAYERLLAALAPMAAGARPARLISAAAAERAYGLAEEAVRAGARSLSGVLEGPDGAWLRPLAIVDCPAACGLVEGDHFGPVAAVVPVGSVEEALGVHRRCAQHLAVSVFSRDAAKVEALVGGLGASNVVVNDCVRPVGHPGVSLGGRGMSGWGVTRGEEGLLAMTRAVCVSRTAWVMRPPYTEPPAGLAERVAGFARWWYGAARAKCVAVAAERTNETVHAAGAAVRAETAGSLPPRPLSQGEGAARERSDVG